MSSPGGGGLNGFVRSPILQVCKEAQDALDGLERLREREALKKRRRDLFAATAMGSLLMKDENYSDELISIRAFSIADAMLEESEK